MSLLSHSHYFTISVNEIHRQHIQSIQTHPSSLLHIFWLWLFKLCMIMWFFWISEAALIFLQGTGIILPRILESDDPPPPTSVFHFSIFHDDPWNHLWCYTNYSSWPLVSCLLGFVPYTWHGCVFHISLSFSSFTNLVRPFTECAWSFVSFSVSNESNNDQCGTLLWMASIVIIVLHGFQYSPNIYPIKIHKWADFLVSFHTYFSHLD